MTPIASECLYCQRTAEEIPLITIQYRGKEYFICPQHLPILIHKPEQLVGLLPGFENPEK